MKHDFVGARLELVRTFRGLTLKQLAAQLSVSFGVLSHYENGRRKQLSDELVVALAELLGVEPEFFTQPVPELWSEADCSFRRRVATPEAAKKRARAHGALVGLVVAELSQHVKFPDYSIPERPAASEAEIESVAEVCRDRWGLQRGPIEHIGRVAERNGVLLVQNVQHSDKVDAFARYGLTSVIVLNTARSSTSRWIFDVAHELGHFVLHRGIETGTKETEREANYFAGALMLPASTFGREFRARPFSWTHAFELKQRWCTSVAAIVRRAYDLGLIDALSYRRAYQQMSVRGWLKREPYEPTFVGPEWLESAFKVLTDQVGVSLPEFCRRVHLTPATFTEITGVSTEVRPAFRPRLVRA